jgi:adenylate cyclase class IV
VARNIELKVLCTEKDHIRVLQALSDNVSRPLETIEQTDRYYAIPDGRLKMRWGTGTDPELIRYTRPDLLGARLSTYCRQSFEMVQAGFIDRLLIDLCGELVTVSKTRIVGLIGATRVHVDSVAGLGRYVELETVVGEGASAEFDGNTEFENVVKLLGLNNLEAIPGSYSDLLLARGSAQ